VIAALKAKNLLETQKGGKSTVTSGLSDPFPHGRVVCVKADIERLATSDGAQPGFPV
jgi:hypothetical protein